MIELPNDQPYRKLIKKELQKQFNTAKTVWGIASSLIANNDRVGIGNDRHLNFCLSGVYAKQMRLYVATYRLCEQGLGNEALLTVRAMFATFINLKAVEQCENPTEFARLWLVWDLANDHKQLPILLKGHPEWEPRFAELKKGIEDEKAKMSNEDWKNFVKNGPSRLNLADLSMKIKKTPSYEMLYPIASGPTHGYDVLFYAQPNAQEGFTVSLPPSLDLVEEALVIGMSLLCDSLASLNFLLKLNKSTQIDEMTALAKSLLTTATSE